MCWLAYDRIVLAVASSKRINAGFWNQETGGTGSPSDRHFFNHVQQLALLRVLGVLVNGLAT